jgi:fused signal recognition particle receptor
MGLFSKLFEKVKSGIANSSDLSDVESALIEADLGAANAAQLIEIAKKSKDVDAVVTSLKSWLSKSDRAICHGPGLQTILIVGVNGVGKTTSAAKLLAHLKSLNQKVIVVAADTFRAAAVEQLQTWGERIDVPVVVGPPNGDPAAIAFDGAKRAHDANFDYLVIDTAGRLHTKSGLMDELGKIKRVVEKITPINEVLLVIDATTGQNGLQQAKLFIESVNVTGLILTKLDGSAKGGIALAIEKETGIPIKFVGTGESEKEFAPFDAESYLRGLF